MLSARRKRRRKQRNRKITKQTPVVAKLRAFRLLSKCRDFLKTYTMKPYEKIAAGLMVFLLATCGCRVALRADGRYGSDTGDCTTKTCQSLFDNTVAFRTRCDSDIKKTWAKNNPAKPDCGAEEKNRCFIGPDKTKQRNDQRPQNPDQRYPGFGANTNGQIADLQKHLTAIMRAINEADQTPVVESLLSETNCRIFSIIWFISKI